MAALICAKDVCKSYLFDIRQNNVLKNVNLEVKEGEMVAIMGPSGSGKSTLLYAISGMDRPKSGQVLFEGKDLTKLREKELAKIRLDEMGFIFQQMYMMKNLTILDNIVLPAAESKKSKESREEKQERGEQLMRKMGIIEIADNDIPDIIQRFHHLEQEATRERTEQSFFVPKQEIVDNGYDLSINKYKKTEYVAVEYPSTDEIMDKLEALEKSIAAELKELRGMLQ